MAKELKNLSEREILALAICSEEEDGRIYGDFAEALQQDYPATAQVFRGMQGEEAEHRHALLDLYQKRFGDHLLLVRRQDVRGFVKRKPVWQVRPLGINTVRRYAESMETETRQFYQRAAARSTDPSTRKLLADLAEAEAKHVEKADALERENLTEGAISQEDEAQRRLFLMQVIQPGLAGLMDGSVSTLAPVFAAAFATHNSSDALRVGLAASIGAGISMAFAEGVSDDGAVTGRGKPLLRGLVCGLMTTAGGIGHTLPYLLSNFSTATWVAVIVVAIELLVISYIRNRYMDTPFLSASFQVIVGGVLVFITGWLIGAS
jgi:rubrerythrin